jgi:hypothetical protein
MTVDGVETDIRVLVEDERRSWAEFQALLASLSPEQAERPGYFLEGWSAKDLLAHVAGWLAEAGLVLEQIRVGTFDGKDMDVEGMNAVFLEANRPQPLRVVHTEASASRSRLLHEVGLLVGVPPGAPQGAGSFMVEADRWLRKAGPEHYAEHLPRLREWVKELSR